MPSAAGGARGGGDGESNLRVTGGRLSGRRLRAPAKGTRPTSDRVREALFARLEPLDGLDVLDLYAGSGALGIEALSRGAGSVVFVERAAHGAGVLRANLASLELEDRSRVVQSDAIRALRGLDGAGERFDLVFMDPPYESDALGGALSSLAAADLLRPEGMVVVERGRRHPLPEIAGLACVDERRYGDTVITRLHLSKPQPRAAGRAEPQGESR